MSICIPGQRHALVTEVTRYIAGIPEAKHINGFVADAHLHFCGNIPDRNDRLVPIQRSYKYGPESAVQRQQCPSFIRKAGFLVLSLWPRPYIREIWKR